MTVGELIEALRKLPPFLEVCVYDAEEDDNVPVVEALLEDGHTTVDLLTHPSGAMAVVDDETEADRG